MNSVISLMAQVVRREVERNGTMSTRQACRLLNLEFAMYMQLRRFLTYKVIVLGLVCFGFCVFVGSIYMRRQVVAVFRSRASASSSLVLGKEIAIKRGDSLRDQRVKERLERLGYSRTQDLPERPGDYYYGSDRLVVYTRPFQLSNGMASLPAPIEINIGGDQSVESIRNLDSGANEESVVLEPEVISYLSNTQVRATTPLKLEEFPEQLVAAVLSIEDERFYYHFGIDPIGILRAMVVNARRGKVVQGGSTLTQQLAKNLFFSQKRSFLRKASEAVSAVLLETAFTKNQILELYFNELFLGQEGNVAIHGFGEAAQSLFGKHVRDLTLAECATLAGIISAPSAYSPRRYPEAARERRDIVLSKMFAQGVIKERDYRRSLGEDISTVPAKRLVRLAPYYVDYLRSDLDSMISKAENENVNLVVHSTMDPYLQQCAKDALTSGLESVEKKYTRLRKRPNPLQSALIALDTQTGDVVAWVGGRDYGYNQFDRVSKAARQPGSLFKPFVYLTALDRNLNTYRVARPTSLLEDKPLRMSVVGTGIWEPKNYDNNYLGEVTVRKALVHSLNIPTINLAMKVGIENVAHTAELLGLGSDLPRVPSLALGAGEVTPLAMARAYSTIASGGVLSEPRLYTALTMKGEGEDKQGRLLATNDVLQERVADASSVYVLTDIMKDVIEEGTGKTVRKLGYHGAVAGKTGTTNDEKDAWFAAFSPRLLALVWVGFDDNHPVKLTGAVAALPIWTEFMKCANEGVSEPDFTVPDGVVFRTVDLTSGLLYEEGCPSGNLKREVFVSGTEPVTSCLDYYEGRLEDGVEYPASEGEENAERLNNRGDDSDFVPTDKVTVGRFKTAEGARPARRRPAERKDTNILEDVWNSIFE